MFLVESFYKSLYNLPWLKAHKKETGQAGSYFFLFCAAVAVVLTALLVISSPAVSSATRNSFVKDLPDFQATVKSGILSVSGLAQPYTHTDADTGTVLVVDTVATSSLALQSFLAPGQSGFLITATSIELFDAQSKQRKVQAWNSLPDFSLSKAMVATFVDTYLKGPLFILLILFLFVVFYFMTVVGKLFSIAVVSLVVLAVSQLTGRGWTFRELFTIGLFAVTLPTLIAALCTALGAGVSYVHFLALLAFMLAVVLTREDGEVAQEIEEPTV